MPPLMGLNSLFNQALTFTKANPIVASAFGLWGLSAITILFKSLPVKVIDFIVSQITTELVINSQDEVYHQFLHWVSTNKTNSLVRKFNLNNGISHGEYGNNIRGVKGLSIGYTRVFFTHRNRVFWFHRRKEQANMTEKVKETLTITVLGRNRAVFQNLLETVLTSEADSNEKTRIYSCITGNWQHLCSQYKRDPGTVIVSQEIQTKLDTAIDKFLSSKDWYVKNGIPYRLGILLEGPPGTGKTSLIKTICCRLNRHLYLINLNDMKDSTLLEALSEVPSEAVVAIEDIDAQGIHLTREQKGDSGGEDRITMSGLLNALDGAASSEDRILIATTNHVGKLDNALLRDGRFDVKLHIGNMTLESFVRYMTRIYPNFIVPEGFELPIGLSPAKVQRLVFENQNDYQSVLKGIV